MCCTGSCKWEKNDYVNGGTRCLKPLRKKCPMDDEGYDEEDLYRQDIYDDDDGYPE